MCESFGNNQFHRAIQPVKMSHYPPYQPHGTPLPHNPHEGPISHTVFPPEMNPNYPHRPLQDPPHHHYPGQVQYPPPHLMPPSSDGSDVTYYPPGHYPPGQYPPPGHYPPGQFPPHHYPNYDQAVAFGGGAAAANPRKAPEEKKS
ncbi:hypothetical protein pipiens_002466 [Culex pipiens pipiens]|uniref:Uncharacterized protein n=3 Tax=Culex pipiens TaxID=7175 RepID=A0ABD1DDW6_CULPP